MRRTVSLLVLLAAASAVAANPSLDVTTSATDPTPITPGDTATVYVSVENTGTSQAKGIRLQYDGHRYFNLLKPSDEDRTVRLLGTEEDLTLAYDVTIPQDAKPGEYGLPFTVSTANDNAVLETEATVTIKPDRPTLQITTVSTEPSPIRPGRDATVTVTLRNQGERSLTDIDVTMNVNETPFLSSGETNTKRQAAIPGEHAEQISFDVTTTPSTTSNVYKVPFTVTFTDDDGNTATKTVSTGVTVAADEALLTTMSDADITTSKRSGEVSVNIVNNGLSDIKLLTAELQEHPSYTARGQTTYYVGNIESDDFDVLTLNVDAHNNTLTVPLELSFRTAFNEEKTVMETVTYNVPQGDDSTSYTPYVIAVLVIAAGIWWYRRR